MKNVGAQKLAAFRPLHGAAARRAPRIGAKEHALPGLRASGACVPWRSRGRRPRCPLTGKAERRMEQRLKELLEQAHSAVFFGGAGVSCESGIPDFRSQDGLYHQQWPWPPEGNFVAHLFCTAHGGIFSILPRKNAVPACKAERGASGPGPPGAAGPYTRRGDTEH